MSRLVPYAGGAAPPPGTIRAASEDPPNRPTPAADRIEAISKYVPAEILAFYVPIVPAINLLQHEAWRPPIQWAAFALAWLLVPVYFVWIAQGDRRRWRQVALSSLAFPIWAYVTGALKGPLAPWYEDAIGVILLLAFSLASAFLLPDRKT